MNVLRDIFQLEKGQIWIALTHVANGAEIAHAFSYGSMGWNAYGVIPLLLRYLNNGDYAAFSGFPFREHREEWETLLAFLLVWVDEDEL